MHCSQGAGSFRVEGSGKRGGGWGRLTSTGGALQPGCRVFQEIGSAYSSSTGQKEPWKLKQEPCKVSKCHAQSASASAQSASAPAQSASAPFSIQIWRQLVAKMGGHAVGYLKTDGNCRSGHAAPDLSCALFNAIREEAPCHCFACTHPSF